jgi:hypothetical protein
MNSPLEIREVRLRGLSRWRSVGCTGSRLLRLSKAAFVHRDGVRQELSAQADIALS